MISHSPPSDLHRPGDDMLFTFSSARFDGVVMLVLAAHQVRFVDAFRVVFVLALGLRYVAS